MTQPIPIPSSTATAQPTTSYQDKCEGCGIQRVGNPIYFLCLLVKVQGTSSSFFSKWIASFISRIRRTNPIASTKTCDKSTLTSRRELYQIWTGPLGRCVSIVAHFMARVVLFRGRRLTLGSNRLVPKHRRELPFCVEMRIACRGM